MRRPGPWVVGVLVLCGAGCALGPIALERNRLKYNEAVRQTWNEQFLLNIVRLRYRDPPQFDAVTNILSSHEFGAATSSQNQFRSNETVHNTANLGQLFAQYNINANANIAERPTLTIAPLEGADFTQHLLGHVHLESLGLLLTTGWDVDRVLRVAVHEMNGVQNVKRTVGDLEEPPHAEMFISIARQMRALQHQGLMEFAYDEFKRPVGDPLLVAEGTVKPTDVLAADEKHYEYHIANIEKGPKDEKGPKEEKGTKEQVMLFAKERAPVMRIAPSAWGTDCGVEQLAQRLHLAPGLANYRVYQGDDYGQLKPPPEPGASLMVSTRSLIGVFQFASKSVQVPQEHIDEGLVRDRGDGSNEVYDWSPVLGGLIRVKSQKVRPAHAFVTTKYRGYWFFIDDDDLLSKSTFALILELTGLELAGGVAPGPLVTIPVGGGIQVAPGSGTGGGGGRGGGGRGG
jgi:hypothetical protein